MDRPGAASHRRWHERTPGLGDLSVGWRIPVPGELVLISDRRLHFFTASSLGLRGALTSGGAPGSLDDFFLQSLWVGGQPYST